MNIYLLSTTAVLTLALNIFLAVQLLKDKINVYSYNSDKKEIINFVLTPNAQNEITKDTEVLATEIILQGDSYNG